MTFPRGMPLVVAGALLGCGNQDDRPPPAPGCENGVCTGGNFPPRGSAGGGDGSDGGRDGGEDAGLVTNVSGAVRVLSNEDFSTASDFIGEGVVGSEGALTRVTATFSGATYELRGVVSDAEVWMDLEATATQLDVMSTLTKVDTRSGQADLFFVQASTVENVGAGLLIPVTPNPDLGHAAVRFVDENGRGVSGISITGHLAEAVAYDTGNGIFRDDQTETTEAGIAVVLNQQALGFPGSSTEISFEGSRAGSVTVKFAAASVTLLTVRL